MQPFHTAFQNPVTTARVPIDGPCPRHIAQWQMVAGKAFTKGASTWAHSVVEIVGGRGGLCEVWVENVQLRTCYT